MIELSGVFLATIMHKLGFDGKWIEWIMECVSTISYSFLINGESKGFLKPTRGIC